MPRSGITYSAQLEWILAAIWAQYTPDAFRELEGLEQAEIVAAYETHLQVEGVMAAEQNRQMERSSKRGRNI